jgi:hypothetical protein
MHAYMAVALGFSTESSTGDYMHTCTQVELQGSAQVQCMLPQYTSCMQVALQESAQGPGDLTRILHATGTGVYSQNIATVQILHVQFPTAAKIFPK